MPTYLATIRIEAFGLAEAKLEADTIADDWRVLDVVSVVQEPSRGTYRSPQDIPKQPCPHCGEMRQPEPIFVPTADENLWLPGEIKCECSQRVSGALLKLMGVSVGDHGDHPLPSEPPSYVTEAIEAAKAELRAEMREVSNDVAWDVMAVHAGNHDAENENVKRHCGSCVGNLRAEVAEVLDSPSDLLVERVAKRLAERRLMG